MKTNLLKFVAAGSALSLLAGCIVLSVYPFYTPKDLMVDPGLAGRWVKAKATNESWQFSDSGGKCYMLTTVDTESTNGLEAHLFRLKQYQFLDLLTTNRDQFQMPVHLIAKAKRTEDSLSLQFLDYDWLTGLLTTNPAVLSHLVVPEKPGDTNGGMLFLTAETKELQKFLLKHAEDTNAFGADSVVELQRAAP
jgi:hypothetical protein